MGESDAARRIVEAVDRLARVAAGELGAEPPRSPVTLEDARDVGRRTVDDVLAALSGTAGPGRADLLRLLDRAERLEDRVRRFRAASMGRRREQLGRALRELRGHRSTAELAAHAAPLALGACRARRVALGRLRDDVWSPWQTASEDPGDPGHRPGRRVPAAVDDLPLERRAVRTGRAVREDHPAADGSPPLVVVVAPVAVDGAVPAVLEVRIAAWLVDDGTVRDVERIADALGRAFEVCGTRDRADAQDRAVAGLRSALAGPADPDGGTVDELPTAELGARPVPGDPATEPSALATALTPRQRETLELMAHGLSNAEIAERLVVGVPTVKSHVTAILRAAGARNRAEAIRRHLDDVGVRTRSGSAAPS